MKRKSNQSECAIGDGKKNGGVEKEAGGE